MTSREIAAIKGAVEALRDEALGYCPYTTASEEINNVAAAALALLALQIPDENRAPPVYPTGLYE